VKKVSGALSEGAATQFSLTVYESPGVVWASESIRQCERTSGVYF
jgi:hypothetical protein